jgi:hypothetical protein
MDIDMYGFPTMIFLPFLAKLAGSFGGAAS